MTVDKNTLKIVKFVVVALVGNDSHTIWESFNFPTDTILGGQSLFDGDELVSSVSISDHSSGHYLLSMQMDGNLVAYPVNTLDDRNDAYWASGTYNEGPGVQLKLTRFGVLFLHYGLLEKKLILAKSSYPNKNGTTTIHRLTLDADGIFRLYLHQFKSDNSSSMLIEWFALPNQCEVGGFCGFNSYCSSRGSKAECKCYPGFNFINDSNKFLGCHEKFNEDDCIRSKDPAVLYNVTSLQNLWWSDCPYSVMPMDKEDCGTSCLEDCNCGAVLYTGDYCSKYKLPLRYGRINANKSTTAFFKVESSNSVKNTMNV